MCALGDNQPDGPGALPVLINTTRQTHISFKNIYGGSDPPRKQRTECGRGGNRKKREQRGIHRCGFEGGVDWEVALDGLARKEVYTIT
ncbi:hypothetical protein MTP99_015603 [Tenebrio molitor]|nr:hypothetical protein MTP99_015603 [Tenebrio molitor]